jgi:hypothetical protein
MPTKQYTLKAITEAWSLYKKRVVYRALVKGTWLTFATAAEAKAAQPHKIEVKLAKDCIDFPAFLATLRTGALD